jgi:phospholipid/cholesterol/gamma-HCH transport system substrate-binding protein
VRPAVESTVSHIEDLSRRISASTPKIEATLSRLEGISRQTEEILRENRENVRLSLGSVRGLTGKLDDLVASDRVKVEKLLDGLDMTRARADRVLYQADIIAGQGVAILSRSRAEIERSVTNVRDATDWGNRLVQKIYTNPFVLSPFYKPSKEDLRVQAAFDAAQVFAKGAQELNDTVKTIETMHAHIRSADQQQQILQLQQKALALTEGLGRTSAALAEALNNPADAGRRRR